MQTPLHNLDEWFLLVGKSSVLKVESLLYKSNILHSTSFEPFTPAALGFPVAESLLASVLHLLSAIFPAFFSCYTP